MFAPSTAGASLTRPPTVPIQEVGQPPPHPFCARSGWRTVVLDGRMAADLTTEREPPRACSPTRRHGWCAVDGFHGDDWAASLLPGWQRAVVAHLALNAGHGASPPWPGGRRSRRPAAHDVRLRRPARQGISARRRRRQQDPGSPARRCDDPQEAVDACPGPMGDPRGAHPGQPRRGPAPSGDEMARARIHHVDLDAGYTAPGGSRLRRAPAGRDDQAAPPEQPFQVKPLDSHRTWILGAGESASRCRS